MKFFEPKTVDQRLKPQSFFLLVQQPEAFSALLFRGG